MTEEQLELPFQRASKTSKDAARSMLDKAPSVRERVFITIWRTGRMGLTDEEIGDFLGIQGNTVRPRRVELEREGRIVALKIPRKTRSGRLATVWVAK
jgi:predicted ArsR family transcriptional regulator